MTVVTQDDTLYMPEFFSRLPDQKLKTIRANLHLMKLHHTPESMIWASIDYLTRVLGDVSPDAESFFGIPSLPSRVDELTYLGSVQTSTMWESLGRDRERAVVVVTIGGDRNLNTYHHFPYAQVDMHGWHGEMVAKYVVTRRAQFKQLRHDAIYTAFFSSPEYINKAYMKDNGLDDPVFSDEHLRMEGWMITDGWIPVSEESPAYKYRSELYQEAIAAMKSRYDNNPAIWREIELSDHEGFACYETESDVGKVKAIAIKAFHIPNEMVTLTEAAEWWYNNFHEDWED